MRNYQGSASAHRLIVTAIVISVVLFFASVSYTFQKKETVSDYTPKNVIIESSEIAATSNEHDTDGDGLMDWEEVLWSTDQDNADTDGDGVSDEEETSSQNTYALKQQNQLSLQITATDTKLSMTETASRELFGAYMYSLKSGKTLSTEDQNAIVDNALNSITPFISKSTYSISDVRQDEPIQENRIAYINALSGILTEISNVQNEASALFKMAQGDRETGIKEVASAVAAYRSCVEKLKQISVPTDAASIHADLIANFENYIFTLDGFTYFEKDPMRSAISINTVQGEFLRVEKSFQDLANYIMEHKLYGITAPEQHV